MMHWEIEYVLFSLGYSPAAAQVGELSLQRWAAFLSAAAAAPAGLPGAQDRSSSSLGPWQVLGELSCPAALPALLLPFHACWMGTLDWQQSQGQGLMPAGSPVLLQSLSQGNWCSPLPLIKAASRLMGAVWGSSALSSCTHTGTSCFTQEFCWSCSWLQCRKHRAWNFIPFSNQHTATDNATFRIF